MYIGCGGLLLQRFARLVEESSIPDGWPMRTPVNASSRASRVTAHDSGSNVVRYAFIVVDFHLQQSAGGNPRATGRTGALAALDAALIDGDRKY
jgi:hypothetical protein